MKRIAALIAGFLATFLIALLTAQGPPDEPPGQAKKQNSSQGANKKGAGPGKVSWSIDAMTATSLTATFEASRDLGDVVIWLTPSLEKYVSADPTQISGVQEGQQYSITLTLEGPLENIKNTVAGTLHVRHDGILRRTFGRPLPVKFGKAPEEEEAAEPAAVVGGADFRAGPVAPGQLVTIFGSGLGPQQLAALRIDFSGKVADYLGDTQVLFDGVPAPLVHARTDQVSVVVPFDVAGKSSTEMLLSHLSQVSTPVELPVAASAPALFTIDASGEGQGAILNQDLTLNSGSNPAARGSAIMLFGTGTGLWNRANVDGEIVGNTPPVPQRPVRVEIGGVETPVLYAGGAPGLVNAVVQVNVEVTLDVPRGNAVPVTLLVGEQSSKALVTVAVE